MKLTCITAHLRMALLLLLLSGYAGLVAAERLRDAVDTALRRNPEVLGAAANLRAAHEAYAQASGGLLPTVDLRMATGREETDSVATRVTTGGSTRTLTREEGNLTLRQNIYDGQQVRSEIRPWRNNAPSRRASLAFTARRGCF